MNYLALFAVVFVTMLMFPRFSFADCTAIFGGGDGCGTSTLTVSKSVTDPATGEYVHDLGVANQHYHPGQTINFHITVTNNGTNPIAAVTVTDQLPSFLVGTGNQTGLISVDTVNLNPGQDQIFTIPTVVVDASHFATNQISCQSNIAFAKAANGETAQDSSQFCVENTPATTNTTTTTLNPVPVVIPGTTTTTTTTTNPPTAPVVYPPTTTTTLPSTGGEAWNFIFPTASASLGIAMKKLSKKPSS